MNDQEAFDWASDKKRVNERKAKEITEMISTPEGRIEIASGGGMKLVYKPFESAEEEKQCNLLEEAARKHQEEFFSDPFNIGKPFFPLFISTRLLVDERDIASGKYKDYRDKSNGNPT